MIDISDDTKAVCLGWSPGPVCADICGTLGIREFLKMALEKSRNFILEYWWAPCNIVFKMSFICLGHNVIKYVSCSKAVDFGQLSVDPS